MYCVRQFELSPISDLSDVSQHMPMSCGVFPVRRVWKENTLGNMVMQISLIYWIKIASSVFFLWVLHVPLCGVQSCDTHSVLSSYSAVHGRGVHRIHFLMDNLLHDHVTIACLL